MVENDKSFYSLIRISLELEQALQRVKQLSTPIARDNLFECHMKLKVWMDKHYKNPGIIKNHKYRELMEQD